MAVASGQMLLFSLDAEPNPPAVQASRSSKSAVAKPAARSVATTQTAVALPSAVALPKPSSGSDRSIAASSVVTKPSLDQLRAQIERLHSRPAITQSHIEPTYSTGGKVLDALLPHGGLRKGTIVQWIGDPQSDSATSLAMIAAAEIANSEHSGGKPLVIFDVGKKVSFYPPAAISLGVPANRMVMVKRQSHHSHAEMIWAIDQALRCEAVAAVWAELGSWVSDRDARRLQLSAEASGTVGLFVRPAEVRRRPSFSDISWFVSAFSDAQAGSNRRLQVEIDRCRGGVEGAVAMVEIGSRVSAERIVAFKPMNEDLPTLMPIRSKDDSTMVSDLARRLAYPKTAKRQSDLANARNAHRAS